MLYDGIVISTKHDVIFVVDEEETLILEEESRSKMLAKQNDPISIEKKINISPINYNELNKLAEDFGKRFVPQMQMSAEQAFWLPLLNHKSEQLNVTQTLVKIEVPKELPKDYIDEYSENLMLKAKLAKKEHMVEKKIFDEVVLGCSCLENRSANLELKLQHQKESFLNNRSLNNQNALEIPEFFKINKWQAKLDVKDVSVANLRKHIESLKGKNVVEKEATPNNAKVIAPEMFKIYLEPLASKVLNNRDAHIDYIKHSRELADTLREIEVLVYVKAMCPCLTKHCEKLVAVTPLNKNKKVRFAETATSSNNTKKEANSHKTQDSNKPMLPSTRMKSSTSASRSQTSDNTKKNRISQTTSSNQKNEVEDHPRSVKSNSNKKNRVIEPVCNANVKHTTLNANSELICVKCNQCMFYVNHDVCFLEFVNGVNVRSKLKFAKRNKKKNIWKPTRKVFTDIKYRWKPTRRTFTIVENVCPLTRITSTKVEPLTTTTSKSVTTPNTETKIYRRKTKVTKSVDMSSETSILGSRLSNISEPNKN
ncbi:hypothetical protein Tco_0564241 [Tanacetum coccineum]